MCVTLLLLDIKTEEKSEPLCIISQNYMYTFAFLNGMIFKFSIAISMFRFLILNNETTFI